MFPNDHSPSQDTARQTSSLTLYSSSTILQTKAPWLYNIPGHRVWRHTKEFLEPFIISSNVQFDLRCLNRSNRNHIKAKTRVQTTQAIPLAFVLYPAALPRREVRAAAGHCTRRAATPSRTHGTHTATGNCGVRPEVFVSAPFKAGRNLRATY